MWGGHMIGWGGMFGGVHFVWWLVLIVSVIVVVRWLALMSEPDD